MYVPLIKFNGYSMNSLKLLKTIQKSDSLSNVGSRYNSNNMLLIWIQRSIDLNQTCETYIPNGMTT